MIATPAMVKIVVPIPPVDGRAESLVSTIDAVAALDSAASGICSNLWTDFKSDLKSVRPYDMILRCGGN